VKNINLNFKKEYQLSSLLSSNAEKSLNTQKAAVQEKDLKNTNFFLV
jgi:hypothetical protein